MSEYDEGLAQGIDTLAIHAGHAGIGIVSY